jgi:hypothetical protein
MAFPIQEQIRDRIEDFLTELDGLIRQAAIASVAQALQGRGAAAPRAPRTVAAQAVAGSRRRRKGQKRDPNELEQLTARLLAHVAKNKGQRIEEIGKAMGTTTKELALPAKKLIAAKKIRTTGTRRATKYFPAR